MPGFLKGLRLLAMCWGLCLSSQAMAQDATAPATPKTPVSDLSATELQLLRDYERFEKSLFDVGEQLRRKDPERAELLYRARSHSQEQNILAEMQAIAELLRTQTPSGAPVDPQYGPAADRQKEVLARMKGVLRLLQAQDERERVAKEIARIQELLKETNRLIARQKDVRADTQRARDPQNLEQSQKKVADEADQLGQKIDKQDKERSEGAGRSPASDKDADKSDKKNDGNQQGKDSEGKDSSGGKSEGEKESDGNKPSDKNDAGTMPKGESPSGKNESNEKSPRTPSDPSQQGSDQKGSEGEQSQKGGMGQSGEGQQSDQSQQQQKGEQTPGREQLEQARREMQRAIERLQQQQKDQAIENQDAAVDRLEELKAQLEQILRQLREDERESYLTMLEARFQNMRRRQQHINTETVRLDQIEESSRVQQNFASQVDNIRKEQEDNALEAEKALHLLKEEGSSVAFPEAVEQMHQNMILVVSRLSRQETGPTTQVVEKLILETLDEMITALRQELQKQQEKKQQGPQGGQGEPQDPGLVNQLAELKLIRSLQNQINILTRQIGTEVVTGEADAADRQKLVQDLKRRQARIQEATYDLSVGRNK
jgi:hypothetical protein